MIVRLFKDLGSSLGRFTERRDQSDDRRRDGELAEITDVLARSPGGFLGRKVRSHQERRATSASVS